jgi:hypothetical protein
VRRHPEWRNFVPNNEWGDFQTPVDLADEVLRTLPNRGWTRLLEPTCGRGSFLSAAAALGDVERVGVEVQEHYAVEAACSGAEVLHRSVFDLRLGTDLPWSSDGPMLVVGNPPWVTNAELGSLGSINLPPKSNLRNLSGMDALTGASNFDIAEFILLKLIIELINSNPTIALLCKTQVARNVLEFAYRNGIALSDISIRRFDAKQWFGASVDACLFTVTVGGTPSWRVPVFPSLSATAPEQTHGFASGRLVADIEAHERSGFADGVSPLEWRQGVKHDAVGVMELVGVPPDQLTSRSADVVDVESDWVFPMLKATDLHRDRLMAGRSVIVTQRSLGEDTESLARRAPKLWSYLEAHATALDERKSSIYRGRPRFSMFGIGSYTFAPWKAAVSGLHASAWFRLISPQAGRPVVLDDTCYLLPFDDGPSAAITTALLRSRPTSDLLRALTFPDSKRPVTKRLLQRIDLRAVALACDAKELVTDASSLLGAEVTVSDFDAYIVTYFEGGQLSLIA